MDAEDRDWPREPTRLDHLLYGIGRVCQAHVLLDWSLGGLQADLAIRVNPSNPEEEFHGTLATADRVDRCRKLLRKSALPGDLKAAANDALGAALEANELRNRVVHDAWFERMEAEVGPVFNRVRLEKAGLVHQPSDLKFVHDARQRVENASGRVNAMLKAIALLPSSTGTPLPEDLGYQQLLPAIRGEPEPSQSA